MTSFSHLDQLSECFVWLNLFDMWYQIHDVHEKYPVDDLECMFSDIDLGLFYRHHFAVGYQDQLIFSTMKKRIILSTGIMRKHQGFLMEELTVVTAKVGCILPELLNTLLMTATFGHFNFHLKQPVVVILK